MSNFEDVMLKRLANCHAEACEDILVSVKSGRNIGDAVLDAIESLPKSKTRELRQWLQAWEAWEEWQSWAAKGWRVTKLRGGLVRVSAPAEMAPSEIYDNEPPEATIAAGAAVHAVTPARVGSAPWRRVEYNGPFVADFTVTRR